MFSGCVCVSEGHIPCSGIKREMELQYMVPGINSEQHTQTSNKEIRRGQRERILTGIKLRFYLNSSHGTDRVLPNSGRGSQKQVGR